MAELTDPQIRIIEKWVKSHNLTILSLENEFIDHICCDVEAIMCTGKSFNAAFTGIQKDIENGTLNNLENKIISILTYKNRIMKLMIRITGFIVLSCFLTAFVLRLFALEEWLEFMAGGLIVLSLVFVPLFFYAKYNDQEIKQHKVLHILGFFSAFLIPLSALLRLINYPFAKLFMLGGIVFLVFGFVPLFWISIKKKSWKPAFSGSILLLIFIILLNYGFLSLVVSKNIIDSWVSIGNYFTATNENLELLNVAYLLRLKPFPELYNKGVEVKTQSDEMCMSINNAKISFIRGIDPSYKEGEIFFTGMDNQQAGNRFLINSERMDKLFRDLDNYLTFLLSVLSDKNEIEKEKICELLHVTVDKKVSSESKKELFFSDFPAIIDVGVLSSIAANVRLAELRTLKFLNDKKK
jgi:hypothetical protein